jgi:phospholipid/cholesterol/gamma-HCH transport system permease protein
MFPMIITLSSAVGVAAGWATSQSLLDLSSAQFIRGLRLFFDPWDVQFAIIKSVTFGITVTGVGCAFGYRCWPLRPDSVHYS